jgi:hypothetical protein
MHMSFGQRLVQLLRGYQGLQFDIPQAPLLNGRAKRFDGSACSPNHNFGITASLEEQFSHIDDLFQALLTA